MAQWISAPLNGQFRSEYYVAPCESFYGIRVRTLDISINRSPESVTEKEKKKRPWKWRRVWNFWIMTQVQEYSSWPLTFLFLTQTLLWTFAILACWLRFRRKYRGFAAHDINGRKWYSGLYNVITENLSMADGILIQWYSTVIIQ